MENKKVYIIEIQGLKESYEGVSSLSEVLENLDNVVGKTAESAKEQQTVQKETKETIDELSRTSQKLADFDIEYARSLAEAKMALSEKNKEIKSAIQHEQDMQTIEANSQNTYKEKQALLSALGRVIKNFSANTDEEKEKLKSLIQRYAEINESLTAMDKEMKVYSRNVGNYASAIEGFDGSMVSMKERLKEITEALAAMSMNGVSKASEEYRKLAEEAGNIKDAMGDAQAAINDFANDTKKLSNVIDVAKTATSAFGLLQSATAALGIENEAAVESIKKMQAAITMLNSLQEIQKQLTDNSSGAYQAYHKVLKLLGMEQKNVASSTQANTVAQGANTAAMGASTVAASALKVALMAIGIGLITAAVAFLVENWRDLTDGFLELIGVGGGVSELMESLSGAMDTLKEVVMGVGKAVIEFLLTPIKTIIAVVKGFLEDGIKGAVKAGTEAFKNGMNVIDNYQQGAEAQRTKNAESAARDRAKILEKEKSDYIEAQEAKYGADWKFTEEGRKAYIDMINARIEMYAKDTEEYRKAVNEKARLEREFTEHDKKIQEQNQANFKKIQDQRAAAYKKAQEEQKKIDEQRIKDLEALKKNTEKLLKDTEKLYSTNAKARNVEEKKVLVATKANTQEELDYKISLLKKNNEERKRLVEESFTKELEEEKKRYDEQILQAQQFYEELNEAAKKDPKNETLKKQTEEARIVLEQIEADKNEHLNAMQEGHNQEVIQSQEAFDAEILKMQTELNKEQASRTKEHLKDIGNEFKDGLDVIKKEKLDPIKSGGWFDIIDVDATKERLSEVKKQYEELAKSLDPDSQGMKDIVKSWDDYIKQIADIYGEDSKEFKAAQKEKAQAMQTYKAEYESALQGVKDITKSEGELMKDFWDGLSEEIGKKFNEISEMVLTPMMDAFKGMLELQLEDAQEKLDKVSELHDKSVEQVKESEEKIKTLNDEMKNASGANYDQLKQQMADEVILLEQRQAEEERLQKEKVKAEQEVAKKEKQMKKVELTQSLISATVNVAQGVTKALSYGPILGPILAAISAALGAVQIATIVKQMSKLEKGGRIKDSGVVGSDGIKRSHKQGGHKIEDTNIEVEGDEWVINRHSSNKYDELLEAINNDNVSEIISTVKKIRKDDVFDKEASLEISKFIAEAVEKPKEYSTLQNIEYSSAISDGFDSLMDSSAFSRNISTQSNVYTTINNTYNYGSRQLASSKIMRYENGGRLNYQKAAESVEANTDAFKLQEAIENIDFQPQVAVTDIERVQKNLTKVRELSGKN